MWDRLLEQAEMNLNMLRASRCNPKLSAYNYISDTHDFNKVPLAPLGTKVVIHKNLGYELPGDIMVKKDGTSVQ